MRPRVRVKESSERERVRKTGVKERKERGDTERKREKMERKELVSCLRQTRGGSPGEADQGRQSRGGRQGEADEDPLWFSQERSISLLIYTLFFIYILFNWFLS